MDLAPRIRPITDDDDTIRRAIEQAEIAPLLPALAWATGDLSLLRDEFRIDTALSLVPGMGLPEPVLAEARALAFDALCRIRDDGLRAPESLDGEDFDRMLAFAVGTDGVDPEYFPLFREELGVGGVDLRRPGWTLGETGAANELSVAVIGAGMSGLLAAHRLDQAGVGFVIIEKDDDVGGTWLENSYPGCRVDVPNHFYSYSFAQRDDWPQHFSSQDELLEYFRAVAEQFGLRDRIRFGTEVIAAEWDEAGQMWDLHLRSSDGTDSSLRANAVISAVGQLNRPQLPDIAGRDTFAGPSFHSARWDHGVDLDGKRVAVIGTGASAMQVIPAIAARVSELVVFQRTPAWLVPTPEYYDDITPEQMWLFRHVPSYAQWYRLWLFWRNAEGMLPLVRVDDAWDGAGSAGMSSGGAPESVSPMNEMLRQFLAAYITEQFGDRPDLLDAVMPHYPPASKRVIRDDGTWARTLKRDNVRLVTTGIERITETGIRTVDGTQHEVDVIVHGTGFSASRFLTPMKVVGRDGVDLHDRWNGDARAYLGMTVPGFPNLFVLYGPNTNIVINGSIIFFSECSVRYILDCLRMLAESGARAIECRPEVHDAYNEMIDEGNRQMAWGVAQVNSWYRNETGRSAQNWPFSLLEYWKRTRGVDPADYRST